MLTVAVYNNASGHGNTAGANRFTDIRQGRYAVFPRKASVCLRLHNPIQNIGGRDRINQLSIQKILHNLVVARSRRIDREKLTQLLVRRKPVNRILIIDVDPGRIIPAASANGDIISCKEIIIEKIRYIPSENRFYRFRRVVLIRKIPDIFNRFRNQGHLVRFQLCRRLLQIRLVVYKRTGFKIQRISNRMSLIGHSVQCSLRKIFGIQDSILILHIYRQPGKVRFFQSVIADQVNIRHRFLCDGSVVYCLEIFQTAFQNRNNTHADRILIFKRHRGKIILQFFLGIPYRQRRFGRQNTVRRNACLIHGRDARINQSSRSTDTADRPDQFWVKRHVPLHFFLFCRAAVSRQLRVLLLKRFQA